MTKWIRFEENMLLKEHVLAIHKIHPYYGYKRMTRALSREGIVVNHKRVRRLMRELGNSVRNPQEKIFLW